MGHRSTSTLTFLGFAFLVVTSCAGETTDLAERGNSKHDDGCDSSLALSGNARAAIACADAHVSDPERRRYWTLIAAENGDSIGQFNIAMELFGTKKESDRARAIFWIKKSAEQGDGQAKEVLQELKADPNIQIPPPPPEK